MACDTSCWPSVNFDNSDSSCDCDPLGERDVVDYSSYLNEQQQLYEFISKIILQLPFIN